MRRCGLTVHLAPLLACGSILAAWTGVASAYYAFGKNKLPAGFDWVQTDVGPYRLVFPRGFEKIGSLASHEVRRGAPQVEDLLGIEPRRIVPIVVYGSPSAFMETKILPEIIPEGVGGFTEFIQGRVALPNTGACGELRHVVVHELTHALMLEKLARIATLTRHVSRPSVPLWFVEGLAQYASSPWTAHDEMVCGDAFLDGRLPDMNDLWKVSGSYLLYCAGHSAVLFLTETFGRGTIRMILDEVGECPFEEALSRVTGMDMATLSAAWKNWLGRRMAGLFERDDPTVRFPPVFHAKGGYLSPAPWGQETDTVACLSYGDGYASIWVRPTSGGKPRRIVKAGGREGLESLHLFRSRLGVSGSGRLAFAAKDGDRDALYVVDGRTGRVEGRWRPSSLLSIASPTFSPGDSLIALSAMDTSGIVDLFLLDTRDGSLRRLTWDVFDDRSPSFSPDGTRLVFHSDRTPSGLARCSNIYELELATGTLTQLTCGAYADRDPVWSPTKAVTFVSDRGGGVGIWETDGIHVRPLVQVQGGAFDPRWSFDGDRLYFVCYRHGAHSIRVARRQGLTEPWREMETAECGGYWEEPGGGEPGSIRPYVRRYSLDLAGGMLTYDPTLTGGGGANLLLSDVLGERRIYLHLSNGAESARDFLSSFNLAVAYADVGPRVARSVGVFRLALRSEDLLGAGTIERHNGSAAFVSYPLSRFHRLDAGTSLRLVEDELRAQRTELYAEVGYVRDTAVWGFEGPWEGTRLSLKLQGALDMGTGTFVRRELFADARSYLRLSRTCTLANRLQWWHSGGSNPRRFSLGGAFSLRGWDRERMVGRTRVLGNVELRFPLLLGISLFTPAGELTVGPLRGACFVDVGRAWDAAFPGLVGSVGAGLRLNVGSLLVLRLDAAARTDFSSPPRRLRTQFFFGWSY